MSKKTIKLSESQLKDAIRESIEKVLNEEAVLKLPSINSTEYNQMRCLNEMAQVNKNERGLNKKASFDANLYRVYVIGEGAFAKFPHFHIEMPSEGWDIRMNMDGSYHSMKRRGGANRQKDEDFKDIERIAKVWVKQPNTLYPQMTNGQAAQFLWNSMN